MEFKDLLELKRDYQKHNTDNYYSLREFIEIFEEWTNDNKDLFYSLTCVLDLDLTRALGIIENNDYVIYDSLEDYIYSTLQDCCINIPDWLCISAYDTYFYSLRYEDNLYFLDDMPQFAKNGEEYGDSASRQKWLDGIRYLVDNSEVILLCDQ